MASTTTYNPILDRIDVPKRWFGSGVVPPELGTALVLERTGAEPIVVWHGHPLPPGKVVGAHRRYVIDVANHGLSFEVDVASAQSVFPFRVSVGLACRVLDPLTIARDGIQDMVAALMPSLSREIRDTAARFDVLQPTEAAKAIELRLNSAHASPIVELAGYSVTVTPLNTQGVVAAKRELGVQEMKREAMTPVSHGTVEDKLAQVLAMNDGDATEVLEYMRSVWREEAAAQLQALNIANNGSMEDVDLADVQKKAFGKIFGENGSPVVKQGRIRDRLERKENPAIGGGEVVEGNMPDAKDGEEKPAKSEKDKPEAKPAEES